MRIWSLLFLSFFAIFAAAILIWWRTANARIKQKMLDGIRAAGGAVAPVAVSTSLIEPLRGPGGLRGLFKPAPADADGKPGWSSGGFLALTAGTAGMGLLLGVRLIAVMGPAAPVIATACGAALPWLHRRKNERKRMAAIEEQFPEALDFLGRSVRAGNALSVGLELLGAEASEPLKTEILRVTRETALGSRLEDALNGLIARVPLVEIRFFVSAVLLQRETGGNLSEVLGKLSVSLRDRMRLRGQVKAASGQGRMTATILTILPIATLGIMQVISPGYLNGMTDDPMGRNLLAGAAVSLMIGYIVMKKIIRIEV